MPGLLKKVKGFVTEKYNAFENVPIEVKASTTYTICSILQRCLSFITLPLFTRLLTITQYGQYTVYDSWGAVLAIFITLNLPYGTFQTAMIKFKQHREAYTSSISSMFAVFGASFLLVYFLLQEKLSNFLELPPFILVFLVVEIVFNSITECWFAKNRFEYRYKPVVFLTLLKAVLSPTLALVLVLLFEEKGYARIIGYSLVNIIAGAVIATKVMKSGKTVFQKDYWKYALSFNIPLVPYYVSQMIFNTSDRLMIDYYCGTGDVAIYGVAYTFSVILTFVINAINNSYAPWFYERLDKGEGEKNKAVSLNLAAIVAFGLWGIIAVAPEFILIMAGKEYASGMWVVPPVAASMVLLFYTGLFDRVLFFYEKKYLLVVSSVAPSILNLILNMLLIPVYGFVAAAYTTFVSYVLFAAINYFLMKKTLQEQGNKEQVVDVAKLLLLFLIFTVASASMMLLYGHIVIRYAVIIVAGIIIYCKRNKIIEVYRSIK